MAEDLLRDAAIRDWVLLPLSVVMFLIGILRYFVSQLMRWSQAPHPKMFREGQVIVRARNLRGAANFIPPKSFRSRRIYFSNKENGLLFVPSGQKQNAQVQMFSDPNMAMDMMKKNLSMIIPQAKIPVPLTQSQRFRSMLQNGIDLRTVDVSYQLMINNGCCKWGGFGFDPTKSFLSYEDGPDTATINAAAQYFAGNLFT